MPPQTAQERLRWWQEELERATRAWVAACKEQGEWIDAFLELLGCHSPDDPPSDEFKKEQDEIMAKVQEYTELRRFEQLRLEAAMICVEVMTWEARKGGSRWCS